MIGSSTLLDPSADASSASSEDTAKAGTTSGAACPKFVFGTIASVYFILIGVWAERQWRLASLEDVDKVLNRDHMVPNYHHINNDRDPFYYNKGSGPMNPFGRDFVNVSGNWAVLCHLDSDGDGLSNGLEVGDPCCRWKTGPPHRAFSIHNNQEYRRWLLTNPGDQNSSWVPEDGQESFLRMGMPSKCDADVGAYDKIDAGLYLESYSTFYYSQVRYPTENHPVMLKHVIGVIAFVLPGVTWMAKQGLIEDLLPFLFAERHLKRHVYPLVFLFSFLFMDLTSGVTHLCLDYMPKWIPIVGVVANGFQVHHMNPALLARKRIWNQVNDLFILMPLPVIFILGTNPTRCARLFWFWCFFYAILFLLAHPWAHMHRDMVPRPVQLLQEWGVLLDQDKHMRHHADLESQFTILSGHSDIVIDNVSQLIPPQRYDLWLVILATWLLIPVFADLRWRQMVDRLTLSVSQKVVEKKTSVIAV
jgi:hypothetical protein